MMLFNPLSLLPALQLSGVFEYAQSLTSSSRITQGILNDVPGVESNAVLRKDAFLDSLVANMSIPELGTSPCFERSFSNLIPNFVLLSSSIRESQILHANLFSPATASYVRRQNRGSILKQLSI